MKNLIRRAFNVMLIISLMIMVSSCFGSKQKELQRQEEAAIQKYLGQSSYTFEEKPSGLYYYESTTGTGIQGQAHDTAYVFYSLKRLNGVELASNIGTTDTLVFPMLEGWMIPGFDEGVSLMKVGGESIMLMPSKLAYGAYGSYNGVIPGYTPLLYDVFLVRVKLHAGK